MYNEENELQYELKGDQDYLSLELQKGKSEDYVLSKYGRMRENYLKKHRRTTYINLLANGKLREHLVEVDKRATAQVEVLVKAMAKQDETDRKLKNENREEWVSRMNNYKAKAEEVVVLTLYIL